MKKNTTHNLTVAAMLSAVAFILMFIEFPIPMLIPSFVKMDFSDLPALLGAFALGPVYGVVISFMKNLLHIIIKGTSTACVGELCNFILGAVFSAVAGFVYKRHKSRKTAILGALAGAIIFAGLDSKGILGKAEIFEDCGLFLFGGFRGFGSNAVFLQNLLVCLFGVYAMQFCPE